MYKRIYYQFLLLIPFFHSYLHFSSSYNLYCRVSFMCCANLWFVCLCVCVCSSHSRRPEAPPVPHRDTSASPPPLPPRCQPPTADYSGGSDAPMACFPLLATTCVNGLQLQLVQCFPPELLTETDLAGGCHNNHLVSLLVDSKNGNERKSSTNRRYSAPPGYLVPML